MTDEAPTTALLERVLARAAEVLIVEAPPNDLDRADAARVLVSGTGIGELARLLAVVDGGTGDRCRCMGWPTILVSDAAGREIAQWTLHHQTGVRGLAFGTEYHWKWYEGLLGGANFYDHGPYQPAAWVTTLGHAVEAWTEAPIEGDAYFLAHVLGGIESAMGRQPFCR